MERLLEYIKTKRQDMNIFEILDIIKEENGIYEERPYEDMVENIILVSKYRNHIYDYQRVFEDMFRGTKIPFDFNWDNFVDLAIGNVIEEMLGKWVQEGQKFRLDKREIEIIRELMKYQFYQSTQSQKGKSKAEIELYFQKNQGYIRNMASFLMGLERMYVSLQRIALDS